MKNTLLILGLSILLIGGCSKDIPKPIKKIKASNYWGCWQLQNMTGYNFLLDEGDTEGHTAQMGNDCPVGAAKIKDGFFRNDTLIFVTNNEYWFKIVGDTLLYSTYALSTDTAKFTRF